MSNPYSSLKIFHHRDTLDGIKNGTSTLPSQVQIILSDLCNQSCSFCAYRWDGYTTNELFYELRDDGTKNHNPNRMLPTSKVIEIIDDMKTLGIPAIQFTGGGEPTLHPNHPDIFEHSLAQEREISLVTNGSVWRSGIEDLLCKAKWVRFSIDAGTARTYQKIRKSSKFGEVQDNIVKLISARRKHKTDVLIGVGFVVTKDNWHEVEICAELAHDLGADNFRISAVFQPENASYFSSFFHDASNLCKEVQRRKFSNPNFKVFNLFGERISDLDAAHPSYSTCGYQHFTTYVGGDQNVYRCCNLAYNPRGLIGSIKDQSFLQLWASMEREKDFSEFDARGCPRCQFNNKNETILYAIDPDPLHVNFV